MNGSSLTLGVVAGLAVAGVLSAPLEKMSEAKSGNWLFLVPREALPALRKAGIITGQRVSA